MANAFKSKFIPHMHILADLIGKLRVSVVVFGVGAQAKLDYDTAFLKPVDEAVKRFVGVVLDRSASIGVRGEFTQRYLGELGFRDVDVIGCPSVYFRGPGFRMEHPGGQALPEGARIALSTALRLARARPPGRRRRPRPRPVTSRSSKPRSPRSASPARSGCGPSRPRRRSGCPPRRGVS
ncbi:polysaccharide pyruvyl transferase family protein [Streptomyces sp. NPDC004009]